MAILKILNKRNNVTYVYESTSYWSKEKEQPRSTRKLIGKIDPESGEIVPTGKRGRRAHSDGNQDVNPSTQEHHTASETPDCTENTLDYKTLYEQTQQELLIKKKMLSDLEDKLQKLTKKDQELLDHLNLLVRHYGKDV